MWTKALDSNCTAFDFVSTHEDIESYLIEKNRRVTGINIKGQLSDYRSTRHLSGQCESARRSRGIYMRSVPGRK